MARQDLRNRNDRKIGEIKPKAMGSKSGAMRPEEKRENTIPERTLHETKQAEGSEKEIRWHR